MALFMYSSTAPSSCRVRSSFSLVLSSSVKAALYNEQIERNNLL